MAGDDHKADTKGDITNYIKRKVRNLLEYDMNEYQDPAWVQAAEIFNEIFILLNFHNLILLELL